MEVDPVDDNNGFGNFGVLDFEYMLGDVPRATVDVPHATVANHDFVSDDDYDDYDDYDDDYNWADVDANQKKEDLRQQQRQQPQQQQQQQQQQPQQQPQQKLKYTYGSFYAFKGEKIFTEIEEDAFGSLIKNGFIQLDIALVVPNNFCIYYDGILRHTREKTSTILYYIRDGVILAILVYDYKRGVGFYVYYFCRSIENSTKGDGEPLFEQFKKSIENITEPDHYITIFLTDGTPNRYYERYDFKSKGYYEEFRTKTICSGSSCNIQTQTRQSSVPRDSVPSIKPSIKPSIYGATYADIKEYDCRRNEGNRKMMMHYLSNITTKYPHINGKDMHKKLFSSCMNYLDGLPPPTGKEKKSTLNFHAFKILIEKMPTCIPGYIAKGITKTKSKQNKTKSKSKSKQNKTKSKSKQRK